MISPSHLFQILNLQTFLSLLTLYIRFKFFFSRAFYFKFSPSFFPLFYLRLKNRHSQPSKKGWTSQTQLSWAAKHVQNTLSVKNKKNKQYNEKSSKRMEPLQYLVVIKRNSKDRPHTTSVFFLLHKWIPLYGLFFSTRQILRPKIQSKSKKPYSASEISLPSFSNFTRYLLTV